VGGNEITIVDADHSPVAAEEAEVGPKLPHPSEAAMKTCQKSPGRMYAWQ
jgi:hypothetical protein